MSKYLYSLICTVSAAGIAMILLPGESRSGMKKHVGLICSLCVLCIIITPFSDLINNISGFLESGGEVIFGQIDKEAIYDEYESIYNKYLDGGYGNNIGQAVKDSLHQKFGIPPNRLRVLTEFSDKNGDGAREPCKITVILNGSSIFREPREIEQFISDLFECICVCAIE